MSATSTPLRSLSEPFTSVRRRFSTYQGINTCGQRLADEMRAVVASAPSLTRISVIAHSMGGLMARYAVGALFNPHKNLVCGLEPCHFVSMATPHCGCDADGVAQVCGC
jgi:triacylglycerol esterase/lipase EstA (alpha/beta hydrolase family)